MRQHPIRAIAQLEMVWSTRFKLDIGNLPPRELVAIDPNFIAIGDLSLDSHMSHPVIRGLRRSDVRERA